MAIIFNFAYDINFVFKDEHYRANVNLINYTNQIQSAVRLYNLTCSKVYNKKQIDVTVHQSYLEIHLLTEKELEMKYAGIAVRKLSEILVQQYGFLQMCTQSNTSNRKLFIAA